MKRKIKFKAGDKELNCFIKEAAVGEDFCGEQTENDCKKYEAWHNKDLIPLEYTGLKDKNGVEIYERDIIQWKKSEQGKQEQFYFQTKQVIFYNGSFGFQEWHTDRDGKLEKRLSHHPSYLTIPDIYEVEFDIEIIGNIYQNSELLK